MVAFGHGGDASATQGESALQAGAGRADVVFPAAQFPLEGFVGQHDALCARVLLLDRAGLKIALAIIDITSLGDAVVTSMKAVLSRVVDVPAEQVIICASHTFSAPHVGSPTADTALLNCYTTALAQAAVQALQRLQPARLGYGSGISRVGVNRDIPTPGGWWLGSNDDGYVDPTIGVLRINALDGRPLALLLNAAVQPSVMDGSQRVEGGKLITADLAGVAARHIEQHFGGASVALFLIGAAGDQAPLFQANRHVVKADGSVERVDLNEAGWPLLSLLGEKLGSAAVRVADTIQTKPVYRLALRREQVALEARVYSSRKPPATPVTNFSYELADKVSLPFTLLDLGELVIVGLQPELSAVTGARIKSSSPYRNTFVLTMADGAAKYLPEQQAYTRFTYEARSSPFAPGGAEVAEQAINTALKQLYHSYQ